MRKIFKALVLCTSAALPAFQSIDINTASTEQLALLPGVGEKLAQDLVDYRAKNGSFVSKDQLLAIQGFTDKKLELITNRIVIGQTKDRKNTKLLASLKLVKIDVKAPPNLGAFEERVLKAHDLTIDFDRSLANRARKSAYLPKLTAALDVDQAQAMAEKKGDATHDSRLTRGGRNVGIGVKVIFDLEKLIFNHDELEVAKLSIKRMEVREEVLKKAHQNYFAYMRLYESATHPMTEDAAHKITLELHELALKLDSLSMGAFTRLQTAS